MTRKLEELVRQATVPLTDAAGQLLGTGFFIAPGLAVSAAHVVDGPADRTVFAPDRRGILRELTVRTRYPREVAPGVKPYPLPDLALLDAAAGLFDDTPCVFLDSIGSPKELLAIGFSKSLDPRSMFAPDVARLEFEAIVPQQGVQVIKVKEAAVDPGMSGAPVLDPVAGAVVGFIKATRGAGKPYGAYAVAISELQTFEHSAWGQSELHHRFNRTWQAAKAGDFDGPDPISATRALAEAVIRDAESRRDILPPGVNADTLHQTIWLRHAPSASSQEVPDGTDPNFRQRWRSERQLSGLIVISGDPGFGKSWLLAYQASQVARHVLHHLDEGGEIDDCVIPVRLTCTALAGEADASGANDLARILAGTTLAGGAADALDERGYVAVVERALADGRMLVCLDGLDEMPTSHQPRLKRALLTLLSRSNAVLMTTRPSALTLIEEIALGDREDFQLVGFTSRETVNFVHAWHHARPEVANALLGVFADRPELAQLAEVPLLLSFLCRLADRGRQQDYRQATLPQLHLDVARHLLSGRWRGDRTPTDAEAFPDAVLRMRLLAGVVGRLQDTWRGGTEDIPKADLRAAIRAHPDYTSLAATAAVRMTAVLQSGRKPVADAADPVLWEFLYDGILVETADAPLRPTVRFIHPLLREMLLATYVADLPAEEQFACIDRHQWLDPTWERVIVASASLVAAPAALVAHIVSSSGDPWATQRTMAAQVIAAVPDYRDDSTAQAVLDAILTGTTSVIAFERSRALIALGYLLRSSNRTLRTWAHSRAAGIGDSESNDESDNNSDGEGEQALSRGNIDMAIDLEAVASLLGARDPAAVHPARTLLAMEGHPQQSRARLISGLVALNTREAVDVVFGLLNRSSSSLQDLRSFLSALQPHANLAVDAAIRILRNRQLYDDARVGAGQALLECGQSGVDAVRSVADDRTMESSIRGRLYAGLLRAAVPEVTTPAVRLLASPYAQVETRAELALALIEDGTTDAIPEAALALSNADVDWQVRRALARALARQGQAGRDLLILQLNHSALPLEVKVRHICALIEVRDQSGIDAALHLHSDRGVPTWIQLRLADALTRYNAGLAEEDILIELATEDEEDDRDIRLKITIEMIRQSRPAAEMVLMTNLRNRRGTGGGVFTWADALLRIAEAGDAGRRCLEMVATASDLDWAMRCEALLSLGKTFGAVPASLDAVVDALPEIWRTRLILGMARVGIAPDLDEFEAVARRHNGGYRIIREFLLRAPVEWAVADRLLDTARELQSHRSTDVQAPQAGGLAVVFNTELLTELGVKFRSAFEAREQLNWIFHTLEIRVGSRIAELMLQEQFDEFQPIMDDDDRVAALDFLETSFPEYRVLVTETFAELKAQITDGLIELPVIIEKPYGTGVLRSVSKIASVLAEWMGHAVARRWDKWLDFTVENAAIIGSQLAQQLLQLSVQADTSWGPSEAMVWVASAVARENLDIELLQSPNALHDWLKGRFEQSDFVGLYYGGAYGAQRFPQYDFAWWYVAAAAHQDNGHGFALHLVRRAGETRPPAEREAGTTILEHFQSKLDWSAELTEEFRAAYIEGVRDATIGDYERAVEDDSSAQSHFNLGNALQQAGRLDEAVDSYGRAAELEPKVVSRQRALAGALDAAGRYEEALAAIAPALALDPADAGSHTTHGVILGKLSRNEEAVLAFREASRLAPANHVYMMNLGIAFLRVKRFDEALVVLRQASARKPQDTARREMVAVALSGLNRLEEALEEIRKALELNTGDHRLYGQLGYILSRLDRHEEAVSAMTEALRLKPEDPQYAASLHFQFWQLGRFDDAVELGLQAVTGQPEVVSGYRIYSDALRYVGRLAEAADVASKGLELAPDDLSLLNSLALTYCDQAEYTASAEALGRAAQIAPGDALTRGNLGVALLLCGRREDAASELREAIKLGPVSLIEAKVMLALAIHPADPEESVTLAQQALTYGADRSISPFRHAELHAMAQLIAGRSKAAVEELRTARPLRRTEDTFQEPLYNELREIAPDHIDALLREWPH
jgi:Flp pilus assembly protein TadD